LDKLYELSKQGKNRIWGGVNSNNNISYYYNKIDNAQKGLFESYIQSMLTTGKYNYIKNKYYL